MRRLATLLAVGKLALSGPTLPDHDLAGVSIYAAQLAEARDLAALV